MNSFGDGLAGAALKSHHANLLDPRRLQIMRLKLFRINIFSRAENDYILLASGDEKIAARIQMAQIAGKQPTIFDNFGSGIRTVEVALHHDVALNGYFA